MEAAITAQQTARRNKVIRREQRRRIRSRVVYALVACMAIGAFVAFVGGERRASIYIAFMTLMAGIFAVVAAQTARSQT